MKQKLKAHFGIKLNKGTKLHVKPGDVVNKGDKLISFPTVEVKIFNDPKLLKFSSNIWNQINDQIRGKLFAKNDILYKSGGLFPTVILVPHEGIFVGIDEFGGIQIEVDGSKEKEIESPVKALVTKIEDDKMTLEFEAIEFKGEGLVEGKAWGNTDFKLIEKIIDLNYQYDGQVVTTKEISQLFLTKAEVMGVTAVVTNKKEIDTNNLDTKLPILALDNDEWKSLFDYSGTKRQVLLNSRTGRLLLVIE